MSQDEEYTFKPDCRIRVELKRKNAPDMPISNEPLIRNVEIEDTLSIALEVQRTGTLTGKLLKHPGVIPNKIEMPFDGFDESTDNSASFNHETERVCSISDKYESSSKGQRSRSPVSRSRSRERSPAHRQRSSENIQSRKTVQIERTQSPERSPPRYSNRSPLRTSERKSEKNSSKATPKSSQRQDDYEEFARATRKYRDTPERRRSNMPTSEYYDPTLAYHPEAPPPQLVRYPHIPYQQGYYPAAGPVGVIPPRIYNEPRPRMPKFNK